jgi:hypothetical protein
MGGAIYHGFGTVLSPTLRSDRLPDGFRPVPTVSATLTSPDFSIARDGCAGVTLQPGHLCEIEIAFRPGSPGDKSASLSLSAPAPCPPFQSEVALRGRGQ